MLYPQSNPFRQTIDLSGFCDFAFDPDQRGHSAGWTRGFTHARPIAVPASWNDQFEDGRDYLGAAWYQTHFDLPLGFDPGSHKIRLRFGSVNYLAEVWLNGEHIGTHEGGHLPFEFDVSARLQREANTLVVRVDGELKPDRVPPGNLTSDMQDVATHSKYPNYPNASFDFFPFCGIHRPVLLYATTREAIEDITVVTDIVGEAGRVRVTIEPSTSALARFTLRGHDANIVAETHANEIVLDVPRAALWSPDAPNLYDLTIELVRDSVVFDRYTLAIGIRTIQVAGDALLLNGKPIHLTGFGRHEDFAISGRGYNPPVIIKDFALLKWIGANSFRTSHYPYSEQMMDLADRLGFLVIDETPAVGLFFVEAGLERRLKLCRQYTHDVIARDKNHPSVIVWSLANEPRSNHPNAKNFFRNLFDLAKSLDATRPVTVVSNKSLEEEAFEFCDLLCLNRYNAWYHDSGQLDAGCVALAKEIDALHAKFNKPLLMAEFGADTIPGWHAQPPEMFSEEFQAELLDQQIHVLRSRPFVVGEQIWNMCDFKTGQSVRRMGSMNYKGVFTRDRRPKLAAHRLRAIWNSK